MFVTKAVCVHVCEHVCVSTQGLGSVICRVGNRKCIFNRVKTLLHPQTGRSQITDQLLCGCQHVRGRIYKWMDKAV